MLSNQWTADAVKPGQQPKPSVYKLKLRDDSAVTESNAETILGPSFSLSSTSRPFPRLLSGRPSDAGVVSWYFTGLQGQLETAADYRDPNTTLRPPKRVYRQSSGLGVPHQYFVRELRG